MCSGFPHPPIGGCDVGPALELIGGLEYSATTSSLSSRRLEPSSPGEAPWSPRFGGASTTMMMTPTLVQRCVGAGARGDRVAPAGGTSSRPVRAGHQRYLKRSYDVPSFDFAAPFGLRQLPGTLDLVGFDGIRASATFHAEDRGWAAAFSPPRLGH